MGRKGSWFSAVKKALTRNESKEKKEKRKLRTRSKVLSRESSTNSIIINGPEPNPVAPVLAADPASPTVSDILKLAHAQNEQNKQVYNSVALATAAAAEAAAAAAQAAAEIVRLTSVASFHNMAKPPNEESIASVEPLNAPEMAAIKIQKLYRGYRIRKELKTLKGILRLKGLVGSKSVKRQAMTTLKCMQTLAHVQSQVQVRRIQMTEENLALQKDSPEHNEDKDWIMDSPKDLEMVEPKMQSKQDETFEDNNWMGSPQYSKKQISEPKMRRKSHDQTRVVRVREREFNDQEWIGSPQSKEQMEAMMISKQEAAIKRERALAYSYSRQQTWRNQSSKKEQPTIQDSQNPDWGWNWLDNWVTGLPCEPEPEDHSSVHSPPSRRISSSSLLHSKPPNGGSPIHRTQANSSPKVARSRQAAPSPLRNATSESSRRTKSFSSSSHTRNSSFSSGKSIPAKNAIIVQ